MGFFNFIETFFFISLGITFILILLLVYHFKERMGTLEKKCDSLLEIINNIVKELNSVRNMQANMNPFHSMPIHSMPIEGSLQPRLFRGEPEKIKVNITDDEEEDDDDDDDSADSVEYIDDSDNDSMPDLEEIEESRKNIHFEYSEISPDPNMVSFDNPFIESNTFYDFENLSTIKVINLDMENMDINVTEIEEINDKEINNEQYLSHQSWGSLNEIDVNDTEPLEPLHQEESILVEKIEPLEETSLDKTSLDKSPLDKSPLDKTPLDKSHLDKTQEEDNVSNAISADVSKEIYRKMNLQSLKTFVITKGLCSDPSKMKKVDLLKLIDSEWLSTSSNASVEEPIIS